MTDERSLEGWSRVIERSAEQARETRKAQVNTEKPFITVQVRSSFGNERVYPMDNTAAIFARLVNTKTFSREQLLLIKTLGYEIHVAAGQLPFSLTRSLETRPPSGQ